MCSWFILTFDGKHPPVLHLQRQFFRTPRKLRPVLPMSSGAGCLAQPSKAPKRPSQSVAKTRDQVKSTCETMIVTVMAVIIGDFAGD